MKYFETNNILKNRVRDLEGHNETLLGANQVLREELERSQRKEELLLEKIFELTGINRKESKLSLGINKPVQVGGGSQNWGQLKHKLEANSTQQYWEAKKRNEEAKESSLSSNVEQLEKDLDIKEK